MSYFVPFVIEDGLVKQGEGVRCATAIELALSSERDALRDELAALKQRVGISEWTREAAESRVASLEEAMRKISKFISGRHKEGDTEYQVVIITRAALRERMTSQEAWGTNEDGIVGDGYKPVADEDYEWCVDPCPDLLGEGECECSRRRFALIIDRALADKEGT